MCLSYYHSDHLYRRSSYIEILHVKFILSMIKKSIKEKFQLIDDDSIFRLEELDGLEKEFPKFEMKKYQILSIIGSQSSGKSTLLNALFETEFEVLNRKKRVGQTTKGIWYSVDAASNMLILDVEGSDSNEREERNKIERRNSLFALAISHTLLINLWIQQIGLYKGSQLAILQIILELNLKLFGSEKPKQIVFVVRDYLEKEENAEALKVKLFAKVEEAWNNIPKPAGKEKIKLSDLFTLTAFFLPSKLEEKEQFEAQVKVLKSFLLLNNKSNDLIKANVPINDLPQYMQNIWKTIESDKDINLPQEKLLLSNMRCQQIKKKVYEQWNDKFRDELEKAQRKIYPQHGANVTKIINEMFEQFDKQTTGYIQEEVAKVREELQHELEARAQLAFKYQIAIISDECLKNFAQEVNKIFLKDKNLEQIKNLKPKFLEQFTELASKVSYKKQWALECITNFTAQLERKFEYQKEKIVNDSLNDFDRKVKKQIQNMVTEAFDNREIFTTNFWEFIRKKLRQIESKASLSIMNLYSNIQRQKSKALKDHIERIKKNATDEVRTVIAMKSCDLYTFIMKHFRLEFNMIRNQKKQQQKDQKMMSEEQKKQKEKQPFIPRQWPDLTPDHIKQIYISTKNKHIDLIGNFSEYNLSEPEPSKNDRFSTGPDHRENDQLLKSKDLMDLNKRCEDQMQLELEEALTKNKQVYSASIPLWGWLVFLFVAIDDIFIWLSSPMIAIPLTLILVIVGLIFVVGGKSMFSRLMDQAKGQVQGAVMQAAGGLLKKE